MKDSVFLFWSVIIIMFFNLDTVIVFRVLTLGKRQKAVLVSPLHTKK